jgi:imidazolonepropionase-like amidohydrolase
MEDTPDDNSGVVIQNLDGMLEEVRRQIKRGVDFIKLGDSFWGDQQAFTDQEISSIVEEAHRRGARVAIHSRGSGSTRASAKAGVDWIMHADLATEEDMEAVAESGVPIVPTMTFMFNAADFASEMGYSQRGIDIVRRNTEGCVRNMELARKLGITVLSGTDTGNSPYTLHGECHMYEAEILTKYVGYTPMEAIVANTKKNAFTIGLEDQLGTVEPGKLADVLILDKDPLADITVLQNPSNIVSLIKDGAIIDTDAPEPDIDIGSFEWPGRHFTAQWLER